MSLSAGAVRFAEIFSLSSLVSQAWLRRGSSNINDGNVIHNDRLQLISLRQARDVDENCNRLFLQSFDCFLPLSSNDGASSSGPVEDLRERSTLEVSKGQITDISPSGLHTLIISSGNDKVYISLTSKSMPYFKREISSIHGKVMGDSGLGGSSWSFDEKFFIYVAMEKTIEAKSSFEVPTGDKFGYQEDWGEKYDGVSKLVLCVLNIETGEITLVPNIDSNELTVGQPVFHPTESYRIVYTAWKNSPRKLGLIYCYQRPANLLSADLTALLSSSSSSSPSSSSSTSPSSSPSSSVSPPPPPSSSPSSSPPSVEHVNLTPTVYTARSPRWTPNGDAVVFIGSMDRIATHNSCFQLLHLPITSSSSPGVNVIVDKVINPGAFPDDFPGLFCDQLPRYCFLSQDELCLTTQWRSAEAVVQVSLRSGSVSRLEKLLDILTSSGLPSSSSSSLSIASCSVLDVSTDGDIVFTASSPSTPQKLGVLNVHSQRLQCAQSPVIPVTSKVLPLLFSRNPRQYLGSLEWSVSSDSPQTESVLLTPVPEADFHSPLPLIVAIHGGPHAASPTTFLPSYAFLSSFLHASVLHVNYRGSTGFGQASIDSLPGNIGTLDVKDILDCIDKVSARKTEAGISLVDASRVSIVGGSHGGFLAAHLIGQFPDLFASCVMRNPVTNIPAMYSTTDIPDWCHIEVTGLDAYNFNTFTAPSRDDLLTAYSKSPIAHLEFVKTPTLICLGGKDRRVPASQGLEYYLALRAKGVKSELMFFPQDVHALDLPASEAEQWIKAAEFILKSYAEHVKSGGL